MRSIDLTDPWGLAPPVEVAACPSVRPREPESDPQTTDYTPLAPLIGAYEGEGGSYGGLFEEEGTPGCGPEKTSRRAGGRATNPGGPGRPKGSVTVPHFGSDEALAGTEANKQCLQRLTYTHDAMIDHILATPWIEKKELAKIFGYSVEWVRRVICSDAFQSRLAERRKEFSDPGIAASVEERMRVVTSLSLEVIEEKLDMTRDVKVALKTLDVLQRAAAMGSRTAQVQINNNQYVVAMPEKASSQEAWADKYKDGPVVGDGK